jgi:hypothetical protein
MEKFNFYKENPSEKKINNIENISNDPSRIMEKKEKREFMQYNKTQYKFFCEESNRLQEELKKTEDSHERDSIQKDLYYVRFRRAQESLFEDYMSDDFDEELFNDELEDVRNKELKYLQKKYPCSENESDLNKSNFYNIITEEIIKPQGLDERNIEFRKKIDPIIDYKESMKIDPSNNMVFILEDEIIGAKKYNKDNYLNKFRDDLEMNKAIAKITKENEEFMSNLDANISNKKTNNKIWHKFYDKFGEDFSEDISELKELGHIPWITLAEDEFSGETAKDWLLVESDLYANLTDGTKKLNLNELKEFEKKLNEFNKKYNLETLSRVENNTIISGFDKGNQNQETSEYKGLTEEEIENSKKFLETLNISNGRNKEENEELEIPMFDDYDKRAEFFIKNFKDLSESEFKFFKEKINPTVENDMKKFIIESIKYDIKLHDINERTKNSTIYGNVHSIDSMGLALYIQRLIAFKSGKILDIDDVRRLSFRQVARDYLNITKLPEGFDRVYSDRVPDRKI